MSFCWTLPFLCNYRLPLYHRHSFHYFNRQTLTLSTTAKFRMTQSSSPPDPSISITPIKRTAPSSASTLEPTTATTLPSSSSNANNQSRNEYTSENATKKSKMNHSNNNNTNNNFETTGTTTSSHENMMSFHSQLTQQRNLKVAVVGCTHGELDRIYDTIQRLEQSTNSKVDLVLCPGDFQAVRNSDDLETMACPKRFREMRNFWKYYAGIIQAPIPTIFCGGNHEAANHLQEIPLGGLVAPNMYYIGNSGVVKFKGLRIAGLSGLYVSHGYDRPRDEAPPYRKRWNSVKSVYQVRKSDVNRLKQLKRHDNNNDNDENIQVFLSHDWPRGISSYGDEQFLLKLKPFLTKEIRNGSFGNPASMELLKQLQPNYWFAAHMHVKFTADVIHEDSGRYTKFLALDKILPRRRYIQLIDIPIPFSNDNENISTLTLENEATLQLDMEWLTILRKENIKNNENVYEQEEKVNDEEIAETSRILKEKGISTNIRMISDFERRAHVHDGRNRYGRMPQSLNFESRNIELMKALGLPIPAVSESVAVNINANAQVGHEDHHQETPSVIHPPTEGTQGETMGGSSHITDQAA